MKAVAVAAMLLLLALQLVAAVNADHDDDHHHRGHGGHSWRDGAGGGHRRPPLAGLTQCVTICGSGVTACMLDCYQPLIDDLDPVELPVCLLKCTNNAMVCASGCNVPGNV